MGKHNGVLFTMEQLVEQKQRSVLFVVLLLITLVLLMVQFLGFRLMISSKKGRTNLPVSMRASSQADYSQDAVGVVIPPINENIFQQIVQDLQGSGSSLDRISTLQVSLSMPVPTMTLNPQMPTGTLPTSPPNSLGSVTPLVTVTPQATNTLMTQTPTGTPIYSPTPTSSAAPTPFPSPTRKPKPTARPKPTRRP
jgi:hypothetical protein